MDKILMFVCILVTISAVSKILMTWIKYRSPKHRGEDRREVTVLSSENAGLKAQVGRLEERLAVLERITVDRENSLAREIEQLRHA